jgi:cell division protein FtsN
MYRVRLGPFEDKAEADGTKERLAAAGFEPALVRAPKR